MHVDWNIQPLKHMVDAKKLAAFKKAGAFIRSDARHSIRVSMRNSLPGQPPLAKRRSFKNSIRFYADKDGVDTGPVYMKPGNNTPHILEVGGRRGDFIYNIKRRWNRAHGYIPHNKRRPSGNKYTPAQVAAIRRKLGQPPDPLGKYVTFYIAPRPYITPALNKNRAKIMTMFS